jgi:hypothetical protein
MATFDEQTRAIAPSRPPTSQAVAVPTLITPNDDEPAPLLSIVIPALNEEITIGHFIDWCHAGIAAAGIKAEIVIVDSSTDRTAEIALAKGARVLKTPKRGLGRAYIDAIPFIRGRYVLMGDADCTYDFRQLAGFVEKFRTGAEFIMGSRFRGTIEAGAMPNLHRYFGTPVTTAILNLMYGTKFTDIHCGMRGMTLDALRRMRLSSQSWEYASEMVLKSVHMDLVTAEVPVSFLKDQAGRFSHHVRAGWFSPWQAGWINLRAMFVYGADFFLTIPGAVLFAGGLALLLLLARGPIVVAGVTLALNSMLIGLVGGAVGLQMMLLGGIARCLYDQQGRRRRKWIGVFRYTRTSFACAALFLAGLVPAALFGHAYLANGLVVTQPLVAADHAAVFGVFLMLSSVLVFVSMLLMQAVVIYVPLEESGCRPNGAAPDGQR